MRNAAKVYLRQFMDAGGMDELREDMKRVIFNDLVALERERREEAARVWWALNRIDQLFRKVSQSE